MRLWRALGGSGREGGPDATNVGIDFSQGDPCRYCGLPADAAFELDLARERGANKATVDMAAKAEARAAVAEVEVARLRGLLREIGWSVERAEKEAGA